MSHVSISEGLTNNLVMKPEQSSVPVAESAQVLAIAEEDTDSGDETKNAGSGETQARIVEDYKEQLYSAGIKMQQESID